MDPRTLHITIAAGDTDPADDFTLAHEVRMAKAALLYGDQVTLASPKAMLFVTLASMPRADAGYQVKVAETILRDRPESAAWMDQVDRLRAEESKPPELVAYLARQDAQIERIARSMAVALENHLAATMLSELELALDDGALKLDPLGMTLPDGRHDDMIPRLTATVAALVGPDSQTLPMFDESTQTLLRALITDGLVKAPDFGPAKEAALADTLISSLDVFPDAAMSTILHARRELAEPLVRFRSAVGKLGDELKTTPVDASFSRAAAEAYRRQVAPELLALDELSRSKGIRQALGAELADTAREPAVAFAISLGAVTVAQLAGLLTAGLGLTGGAAIGVLKRRADLTAEQRKNQFYFLFEARRRLR
jgi:hypothetical protein